MVREKTLQIFGVFLNFLNGNRCHRKSEKVVKNRFGEGQQIARFKCLFVLAKQYTRKNKCNHFFFFFWNNDEIFEKNEKKRGHRFFCFTERTFDLWVRCFDHSAIRGRDPDFPPQKTHTFFLDLTRIGS